MSIYQWQVNSAKNATIGKDISWRTGQLAGLTNGSMRNMMSQFRQWTIDRTIISIDVSPLIWRFACGSKINKLVDGMNFLLLFKQDVTENIPLAPYGVEEGAPIKVMDSTTGTWKNLFPKQLKIPGIYHLFYKKDCWQIVNFDLPLYLPPIPLGTICVWPSETPPKNWMICNGQRLYVKDYPGLYQILEQSWGKTDKNYFFLPDFRGVFLSGYDPMNRNGLMQDFGELKQSQNLVHNHKAQLQEDGEHSHRRIKADNNGNLYGQYIKANSRNDLVYDWIWESQKMIEPTGDHMHKITLLEKGSGACEMRPQNVAINYIIKVKDDN